MEKRKIGQPSQYHDVMTIEGADGFEASEQEYYEAIQRQVNAGQWSLQGSHGRTMMEAIQNGNVMLGRNGARDYWGNYIPSRDQVQDGTKGSPGFVAEHRGQAWADRMAAL